MDIRDAIITPFVLIVVYVVAFMLRSRFTDSVTRRYFIPALSVKVFGAICVGLVYQFYYGGGDTFNYHTYGSRYIWQAFFDSPTTGLKLLFSDSEDYQGIYRYASKIPFFRDPQSYAIVKIAGFLDLFTFSTYSATAVLFALFSFMGMWMFFLTFYKQYPWLHRWLAIASFFIPSVFFWGSGLLKDTITLGCLGMSTYLIYKIFIVKGWNVKRMIFLVMAMYGLYVIKIYILLTFLPAAIMWVFMTNLHGIRSPLLRLMAFPFVISLALFLAYFATLKAGENDRRYALNTIAKTAQVTAYDIRYQTGKDAGSGYSLGELDGTFGSMIKLAPQAINVSLFRPYLWEVRNPFMLLSALESFALLAFFFWILVKRNARMLKSVGQPNTFFTLIFSISFAFAVGVSTYNFGTLVRYKIPLLPFFSVALILLYFPKSDKNVEVLEETEY